MTDEAMPDAANLNEHVDRSRRIPGSVKKMKGLQQHSNAAAMFAISNYEKLGNHLKSHSRRGRNLLKKFNDEFEKMGETEKMGERKRQIVVAGIKACMHHLPSDTMERVGWFVETGDIKNMYYKLRGSLTDQLVKYYDSAVEAYLLMKVFHDLEGKYGKL